MTHSLKTLMAAGVVLTLGACAGPGSPGGGAGGGDTPPVDRFAQTINFASAAGPLAIDQSFLPGAGSPGNSRVCFRNRTAATATLMHGVAGINPLRAQAGGQSCANFRSAARVNFTLVMGDFPALPATPDRNFVYTMAPFEGGLLNLNLRTNR